MKWYIREVKKKQSQRHGEHTSTIIIFRNNYHKFADDSLLGSPKITYLYLYRRTFLNKCSSPCASCNSQNLMDENVSCLPIWATHHSLCVPFFCSIIWFVVILSKSMLLKMKCCSGIIYLHCQWNALFMATTYMHVFNETKKEIQILNTSCNSIAHNLFTALFLYNSLMRRIKCAVNVIIHNGW